MNAEPEFETRWRECCQQIMRVCLRYLGNQSDAEDVFQQVAVRAWRAYASFRGDAQFSTWVQKIAMGEINRALRRKISRQEVALSSYEEQEAAMASPIVGTPIAPYYWLANIVKDALEKSAINEMEFSIVTARLSNATKNWHEIGATLGIKGSRCAIEHSRAIPKLCVFLFRFHPHRIGGLAAIAEAFTSMNARDKAPFSQDEIEAFRRIVLEKQTNYRKAGWQSALRSVCAKVIKFLPMP